MTRPRLSSSEELVVLLASVDPRDRKRALQEICAAIEADVTVSLERSGAIASLVSAQRNSGSLEVRRWLYKLYGLLRERANGPYLKGQYIREENSENKRWAGAALVACFGDYEATQMFQSLGVSADEIARIRRSARYFRPALGGQGIQASLGSETDELELRWISLVYGAAPGAIPREFIADLNVHPDPGVAEYSIWALVKDPAASLWNSRLTPQDVDTLPPNVRRWFYQLAAKGAPALSANWDLIEHGSRDAAKSAREGVALALKGQWVGARRLPFILDWYEAEQDKVVRRELVRYLISIRHRSPAARDFLLSLAVRGSSDSEHAYEGLVPLPRRRRVSSIFVQKHRAKRGATMLGVPRFTSSRKCPTALIAVDTVDFSMLSDEDQFRVASTMLDSFAIDEGLSRLATDEVLPLYTGDGLIIGVLGAENARVALDVTLRVREAQLRLSRWELRYGVHIGTVHIMDLSDGSRQMLGHAVNQSARIMTAAVGNQVLVSDVFYADVLHDGREPTPGYRLDPVTGLADKHGNTIRAHEVKHN